MCEVNFITQFGLIMEYCRENCVHSRERMLMLALFHCANRVAQQSVNHEWPDEFFTISNAELNSWCDLDKRSIETLRNSLKQRGLIDFTKGSRNKSQPTYKINYLMRVGCKIVPNNDSNIYPNNAPNRVSNNVPNNDPNNTPFYININTGVNTELKNNTHTVDQQQGIDVRGREEQNYFDPANPTNDDTGWRHSNRVRCRIAQKLIDHHTRHLRAGSNTVGVDEYEQLELTDTDAV